MLSLEIIRYVFYGMLVAMDTNKHQTLETMTSKSKFAMLEHSQFWNLFVKIIEERFQT